MEKKIKMDRIYWFLCREGSLIYEAPQACKCANCTRDFEQGLLIQNYDHAVGLYMKERSINTQGRLHRFFDNRTDQLNFLKLTTDGETK